MTSLTNAKYGESGLTSIAVWSDASARSTASRGRTPATVRSTNTRSSSLRRPMIPSIDSPSFLAMDKNTGDVLWSDALTGLVSGGVGTLSGAVVGGLIIGVTESLSGVYLPEGWKDISAWIILIGVLIIRPQGLFGIQEKKKV